MNGKNLLYGWIWILVFLFNFSCSTNKLNLDQFGKLSIDLGKGEGVLINAKASGYQGIWYQNQPLDNVYRFKYSGGLGTYPQQLNPFAVYSEEVDKTFFCYGGTDDDNTTLLYMVSYFDHKTGMVPNPTLVMNKNTTDAHDNPVLNIDDKGFIWLFGNSHGRSRPSYVMRSKKPFNIDEFEIIKATKVEDGNIVPMDNFSYMQAWHLPNRGFVNFFTKYSFPADRTICYMTSSDGESWSEWQRLAAIKKGHYQISTSTAYKAGTVFDFHPDDPGRVGLNYRTNIYYVETTDFGNSWQSVEGKDLILPLTEIQNDALVYDYYNEGLLVYLKDLQYDEEGNPIILYLTSKGFESGPENNPRTWRTARWDGAEWIIRDITTSDNNYDHGSLYIDEDGTWTIIAPTTPGPQAYNPGGEMVLWSSTDQGETWKKERQLTHGSNFNNTYARRPVNANSEFYSLWADGDGRGVSRSAIYFCDKKGNTFKLPRKMTEKYEKPIKISGNK